MVNFFGPGLQPLEPSKQISVKTHHHHQGAEIKFEKGSSSETMFNKLHDEIISII